MKRSTTDLTLFIRTSSDEIVQWNRQKIIDALTREAHVDLKTAEAISIEVEKQIFSSGIGTLTAPLVRELVNAKLIERGLESAYRMHTRVGFPLYDVSNLILTENNENAGIPHWPEGTNLVLAEGIKKEFALNCVFSRKVADAHVEGDLHILGLGAVDRPYRFCQSLEYVKKFGLTIPHSVSTARPARHAEVLLAHLVRFTAALQGAFAGPVEWDAVNILFAPYLTGMSDAEIRQLAQMLVYEFSQLTSARGGQLMNTSIGMYRDVPAHLESAAAIGPGGEFTGKKYRDYLDKARRFMMSILTVLEEGDSRGRPFFFPQVRIHLTEEDLNHAGADMFLARAAEAAVRMGNVHFVFDRDGKINFSISSLDAKGIRTFSKKPESLRFTSIQDISLNLPRSAYRAKGDDSKLFAGISGLVKTAVRAHLEKKAFIDKLVTLSDQGPFGFLSMDHDGSPVLDSKKGIYHIGLIGLNECVRIHCGRELHEDEGARTLGLKLLGRMKTETEKLGKQHGISILLEHDASEITAYRFARLDLRYFSPVSGTHVKGDLVKGSVYYTNFSLMPHSGKITPQARIRLEAPFHPYLQGGCCTTIWLTNDELSPREAVALVRNAVLKTKCRELTFAPEFSSCPECKKTVREFRPRCLQCRSEMEHITRITGYFARTSSLNQGKSAETADARLKGLPS